MVSTVETVHGKGLYTVVTKEEYVVVNGIIASPFAANHMLANLYYNFHRLVYASAPSFLSNPSLHLANEVRQCYLMFKHVSPHHDRECYRLWPAHLIAQVCSVMYTSIPYLLLCMTSDVTWILLSLLLFVWPRFLDHWFQSRGSPFEISLHFIPHISYPAARYCIRAWIAISWQKLWSHLLRH